MNLKRIAKIPLSRMIKKIVGEEEIYTIGIKAGEDSVFSTFPYNKDYWYADPVLYKKQDQIYLFMEAFNRKTAKGEIAFCLLKKNGEFSKPITIISERFHLSFPSVFEWQDRLFMIPEGSETNNLLIYECKHFPHDWVLIHSFDVKEKIVDCIILEKNKTSILVLCSKICPTDALKTKFKIYKITLMDKNSWSISEEKSVLCNMGYTYFSRNAGPLFEYQKKTVLPVQVSTEIDYGVSIILYEYRKEKDFKLERITDLTKLDVQIDKIMVKKIVGIHTLAFMDNLTVIDVRYRKFNSMKWIKKAVCLYHRKLT